MGFIKKTAGNLKDLLPQEADFWFDPDKPILDKEDFTNELYFFGQRKGIEVEVVKESMNPNVMIDGHRYLAVLQSPKTLNFPFSIFFAGHTYGYKAVYLFKIED